MRWLLPLAVAALTMMNAAFGLARAHELQGTWSTARLSVARGQVAATSVGNLAMFAGGGTGALLCSWEGLGC